ncbi:hypothetical protein EMCRGX_G011349 [Ephydatia muelleri]
MSHPDELIFIREQVRLLSDRVSLVEAFARQNSSELTENELKPKQLVPLDAFASYPELKDLLTSTRGVSWIVSYWMDLLELWKQNYYSMRRSSKKIETDEEMHRKRRLSLTKEKYRLTYLAREKAVKNAIKEGKIALEDKEGIDKIRKSVPVNAEDVNLDEDVSVDHVKRRLEILSKARAARQVVNSEGRTSISSRESDLSVRSSSDGGDD